MKVYEIVHSTLLSLSLNFNFKNYEKICYQVYYGSGSGSAFGSGLKDFVDPDPDLTKKLDPGLQIRIPLA
jgi:hypothetical protein